MDSAISIKSHELAAKALASLHICTGSPEPRHSYKTSCVGSNGDLCTVYVNSDFCGEPPPAYNGTSVQPSVCCINVSKMLPVRGNKIPQ